MEPAKTSNEHTESPWAFTFADRLGKALHVSGVSNQDMADALGVSRATVSNYTSGRTSPSKLQLKEWALKTGAPIEWLLTGGDPTIEKDPHTCNTCGGPMEPPARLELATCSLQGGTLATVTPLFARFAG